MQQAPRFVLVAVGSLLSVGIARADQFVLTDVSYTHSTSTTTDSHYRVTPLAGTPKNWVSPVDYSKGAAYVRVEIKTKPPGDAPTRFQICFEGTPAYACTAQSMTYTTTGVREWTTPFSEFYQGNGVGVDWSKGVAKVALILKDDMNNKPAPENVDAGVVAKYMPTDLHVVVGIVTAGAAFKPAPPDAGVSDAGQADAAVGDAGRADAGASDAAAPGAQDAALDASSDAAAATSDGGTSTDAAAPAADAGTRADAGQHQSSDASARADAAADGEADDSSDGGCSLRTRSSERYAAWSVVLLAGLVAWRRRRRMRVGT